MTFTEKLAALNANPTKPMGPGQLVTNTQGGVSGKGIPPVPAAGTGPQSPAGIAALETQESEQEAQAKALQEQEDAKQKQLETQNKMTEMEAENKRLKSEAQTAKSDSKATDAMRPTLWDDRISRIQSTLKSAGLPLSVVGEKLGDDLHSLATNPHVHDWFNHPTHGATNLVANTPTTPVLDHLPNLSAHGADGAVDLAKSVFLRPVYQGLRGVDNISRGAAGYPDADAGHGVQQLVNGVVGTGTNIVGEGALGYLKSTLAGLGPRRSPPDRRQR